MTKNRRVPATPDALDDFVLSGWSNDDKTLGLASTWPQRQKPKPAQVPPPVRTDESPPSPTRISSLVDAGRLHMYKLTVPRIYSNANAGARNPGGDGDWTTYIAKVDFDADTIPDEVLASTDPLQPSCLSKNAAPIKPVKSSKKTLQELHPGLNRVWPYS
ncbi:hypothetical protein SPRG_17533 [Saprolegnia parasitica CBS 223.65]|uniref:Uncharacterized protein n=1 Tax=Saprolegnia parasitica (strain CBS 223.65) TaxID=695850 RepID=A0A067BQT4_SAPPC|nr:hypothetical protein SPRG_17533 [Saprolegnia parasitica CBS 223.65]KDO17042.1 hypothetical protein SPRG_17533 [Saprolegnia parasitica CBS 223.65]|eukprot:XP_012212250.1 hypothetical protein SPRG_17533 [Saprolegnia parasitica CBS 223.65]